MPTVRIKPDTLNQENSRFVQKPLTQPLFLNSVPKSGSHLLRNIVRMFVPVEQQYDEQFIQWGNLQDHIDAFESKKNYLSWGHLLFSDASAIETSGCRKIILVRDPYDWVLARGRFFVSDEFVGNAERLKEGTLTMPALLNLMIFGIHQKAPPMSELYHFNAVAWLGTGAILVRYEDLVANIKRIETPEAKAFFHQLLDDCGIIMPVDWRERVVVGSDRKQSGTARENLSGGAHDFPNVLPEMQKRLVDYAVPGLRALLGYG
ncbi:MAG: hypothetical protein ABI668_15015 [Sphingorhabdus sp.]